MHMFIHLFVHAICVVASASSLLVNISKMASLPVILFNVDEVGPVKKAPFKKTYDVHLGNSLNKGPFLRSST